MRVLPPLAALLMALAAPAAQAQGMAAGERARGESRCPVGTVGEAVPGGFRCTPAVPIQQGTPVGQPAGAAGGQAREVSRGVVGALPFAAGAAAVLGLGVVAAASQGGSSAPAGTR